MKSGCKLVIDRSITLKLHEYNILQYADCLQILSFVEYFFTHPLSKDMNYNLNGAL